MNTRKEYLRNYYEKLMDETLTDDELAIILIHINRGKQRIKEMREAKMIPADVDLGEVPDFV